MIRGRGTQPKRGRGRPRKLIAPENTAIEIPSNEEAQGEDEVGKQKDEDTDLITNQRREIKVPSRFSDLPEQPAKRKRKRKNLVSSDERANFKKLRKNLVQDELISNIMGSNFRGSTNPSSSAAAEGLNPSQDFSTGDIVWVVSDLKNMPTWPGKIIDYEKEDLPPSVLSVYNPGCFCVMLLGPSFKEVGTRDYVWARPEMIFPFSAWLETFQNEFETVANKRSKTDFDLAMEEATLRECNVLEDVLDKNETTAPARNSATEDETGQREAMMYLYKQLCDICRRVCSDDEYMWLNCHKCDVWCHSGCDPNGSKCEDDDDEYMCPKCRLYLEVAEKNKKMAEAGEEEEAGDNVFSAPYRVNVVCGDREAVYLPHYHLVLCECKKCNRGNIMSIGDWELHTGCKKRKWTTNVTLKGINVSLIDWLNELQRGGVVGLAYFAGVVGEQAPTPKERDLIVNLQCTYEPYKPSWSIGTCAVCLSRRDKEYNKIIICKTCQIAVHQECYGARNVEDEGLATWVCRACERPDIKRECCLCPVVGGALKPTTTRHFWVHVTCAWLVKGVEFQDEDAMEPAEGVLRADSNSFKKTCIICNQIHGSCIQCCKCPRSFHAMCAALAGYWIQFSIVAKDKSGRDVGKWFSYCLEHKTPKSQHYPGLIFKTPKEKPSKPKQEQVTGSIPTHSFQLSGETQGEGAGIELITSGIKTASRCRAWPFKYKKEVEPILHLPKGYSHHSPKVIEAMNSFNQQQLEFSSLKERLRYALENEKKRVCFGKSVVHGFGLFARIPILQGEMVIEYRGEKIKSAEADAREKLYKENGINNYFFTISENKIIDATKKGNMARLLNHSCDPNLNAKVIDGEDRIELIATRDIKAGEELNFDYRFGADQDTDEPPCNCGAPNCRKYMCNLAAQISSSSSFHSDSIKRD